MKRSKFLSLKVREVSMIAHGLLSSKHPVLAHIIPMRRCNLACAYCNEYDKVSDPVPLEEMNRRIDKLGALGTAIVTISGGEPLMHPELDDIIRRIRSHKMIAGLISNGYYFTPERIKRLNDAGIDSLQISIDNVEPDSVSKKSLKNLDKKLQHLSEHAQFHVNINSVIGGGIKTPEDALVIARRAVELGFSSRSRSSAITTSRGSTGFRTQSPRASLTNGAAAPERATSTSARTVLFTGARSSAAIPALRSPSTR